MPAFTSGAEYQADLIYSGANMGMVTVQAESAPIIHLSLQAERKPLPVTGCCPPEARARISHGNCGFAVSCNLDVQRFVARGALSKLDQSPLMTR